MNRYKNVKIVLILAAVVSVLTAFTSCDSISLSPVDCSECYTDEPKYGEIELKLTINPENPEVFITLYEEEFNEANAIFSEVIQTSTTLLTLRTNKEYVVKAEYLKDGRSYHVINRANLKTKRDYETCSDPCYYIINKSVDLRIKE
jgi:hypothetical protein